MATAIHSVADEVSRAFSTIREMLKDRGLDVTSLDAITNEDVANARGNDDVFSVDIPSCSMRVVFNLKHRFSTADVKKLLHLPGTAAAGKQPRKAPPVASAEDEEDEGADAGEGEGENENEGEDEDMDGGKAVAVGGGGGFEPEHFIIVARQRPAQGKTVEDPSRNTQLFLIGELMFNLTKHELQPMAFLPIRDEDAIQEIMRRYRLKAKTQFPLILHSDPVARYFALKPGQLIKITCRSPSAGTYPKYRCCT